MDAVRAYQCAFDLTVKVALNTLQVRTPGALGFVVGVADTVSDRAAFAA
jgi:hypothetical protein